MSRAPSARPRRARPGHRTVPDLSAHRRAFKGSFIGRCLTSFAQLQGLDRAMVLASQSFTALIPLVILISAVLPTGSGSTVADSVTRRFELTGDAARSVEIVFARSGPSSVGLGSLILLIYSGVSLTRRLQRLYLQAYGLPPPDSVRGSFNAALGLGFLLVEIALLYFARTLVRAFPFDWAVGVPMTLLASVVLWTSVPCLLLDRRLPWQRLLPAGVLAGSAVTLFGVATPIYMSRLMTSYSERYGLFGVTIAIVGWLLATCILVVASTVVAAEFDKAPESWAVHLRIRLGAAGPRLDPGSTTPEPPYPRRRARDQRGQA